MIRVGQTILIPLSNVNIKFELKNVKIIFPVSYSYPKTISAMADAFEILTMYPNPLDDKVQRLRIF